MTEQLPYLGALIAAALIAGLLGYLLIRWRRAPIVFKAMLLVSGLCFIIGIVIGIDLVLAFF